MKFGPEVDEVLGGRLEGATYNLPQHCAAILRALLLSRPSVRLCINSSTDEISENRHVLKILTAPLTDMNDYLDCHIGDGFIEERDLTRIISNKSIRVHVLRRGSNAAVALIQKTTSSTYNKRVLQAIAFLPRLLPGLFAEKKVSELELSLLKAASEGDLPAIEALLDKMYKESDFCNERQKRLLHNVISSRLETALRKARDEIGQAEHNANIHLQRYMESSQYIMQNKILAEDYERRIEAMSIDVDDLMGFLNSNKAVSVDFSGSTMYLDITGPLTNFDPDAYRAIRNRSQAHFLCNIVGDMEDALLFFDALFLEETIKVNMGARYSVDSRNGVSGKTSTTFPTAIPNPHIQYYSCLGQYKGDMQAALSKSDFIGVISLCNASALSLNIPESPTCGRFIRDVTGGSHKAILLPGGEAVTYRKAVAWLKQQKGIDEGGEETNGETNPADGSGG